MLRLQTPLSTGPWADSPLRWLPSHTWGPAPRAGRDTGWHRDTDAVVSAEPSLRQSPWKGLQRAWRCPQPLLRCLLVGCSSYPGSVNEQVTLPCPTSRAGAVPSPHVPAAWRHSRLCTRGQEPATSCRAQSRCRVPGSLEPRSQPKSVPCLQLWVSRGHGFFSSEGRAGLLPVELDRGQACVTCAAETESGFRLERQGAGIAPPAGVQSSLQP